MDRRQFLTTMGGVVLATSASGMSSPLHALSWTSESRKGHYLDKIRNFDANHMDDVVLSPQQLRLVKSIVARLRRVRGIVGHGRFALIGFDDMLRVGRDYSKVGVFPQTEIDFLEQIFYRDASAYGFLGEKVLPRLTDQIQKQESAKVRPTGQYLFKGRPRTVYANMRRKLGKDVVLTSGVRGMAKQMYLFLAKAVRTDGNLSRASRSLAPPGYSFHAAGDFDVGKRGWGVKNFSVEFEKTDVFHKLVDLGYAQLRYPEDNLLGVRYEPWHIKVV